MVNARRYDAQAEGGGGGGGRPHLQPGLEVVRQLGQQRGASVGVHSWQGRAGLQVGEVVWKEHGRAGAAARHGADAAGRERQERCSAIRRERAKVGCRGGGGCGQGAARGERGRRGMMPRRRHTAEVDRRVGRGLECARSASPGGAQNLRDEVLQETRPSERWSGSSVRYRHDGRTELRLVCGSLQSIDLISHAAAVTVVTTDGLAKPAFSSTTREQPRLP